MMNVPWPIFAIVCAALVGVVAWTFRDLKNDVKEGFRELKERLDTMNGKVSDTGDELNNHMLWASDHYVKKEDCKDDRDGCPARKEAIG